MVAVERSAYPRRRTSRGRPERACPTAIHHVTGSTAPAATPAQQRRCRWRARPDRRRPQPIRGPRRIRSRSSRSSRSSLPARRGGALQARRLRAGARGAMSAAARTQRRTSQDGERSRRPMAGRSQVGTRVVRGPHHRDATKNEQNDPAPHRHGSRFRGCGAQTERRRTKGGDAALLATCGWLPRPTIRKCMEMRGTMAHGPARFLRSWCCASPTKCFEHRFDVKA